MRTSEKVAGSIVNDTPIYNQLVREWYAQRCKEAYAASPDMIGCGQWELLPENFHIPAHIKNRRTRTRIQSKKEV